MEAEARLYALTNTLGEIKVETKASINTMHQGLAEQEAEAPKDTLADSLADLKAQKVSETLTDVKGASLF